MSLLLLLGSGISQDAGMPMVDDITAQVSSGSGVFRGTDQIYRIDPTNPNYPAYRPAAADAIKLVNMLEPRIAHYYGRQANYEEVASCLGQIVGAVSWNYDNPAIDPLIDTLVEEGGWANGYELGQDAEHAHDYIRDTIWAMLARPAAVDHLVWLADICARHGADVATLNHDLVIESAFDRFGVAYSDGFDDRRGELAFFNDDFGDASVRLLKLHGSISWWGHYVTGEEWRGRVTARSLGEDAYHPLDATGAYGGYPYDLRPILLTGTFDKIMQYEGWILPDQHYRFAQALRHVDRILVVGYGFGDKAINTRLIRWLARSINNRLIVAHGGPEDARDKARVAIRGNWDRWIAAGRLHVIPVWAAKLDSASIEAALV